MQPKGKGTGPLSLRLACAVSPHRGDSQSGYNSDPAWHADKKEPADARLFRFNPPADGMLRGGETGLPAPPVSGFSGCEKLASREACLNSLLIRLTKQAPRTGSGPGGRALMRFFASTAGPPACARYLVGNFAV